MKHIKKFNEAHVDDDNYIGGVDGEWGRPSKEEFPEGKQDKAWTTKSGKKIPVSKMSKDHLKNSIDAIINGNINFKNEESKYKWAHILLGEYLSR